MAQSHEYYAQRIVRTCRGPSNRRPSRTRHATTLPSLGARSSSAHAGSLHLHNAMALEPRTAQVTRQCAVRVRAQQRGQAHRRSVRWNVRCPKCRGAAHLIHTCESRAGESGMSVARGRRTPSSGGCTYLRGIKVVRWPRIQPPDVALQQTGRHASGGASVRRRRRVVTHHRGGRCARCLACINCCLCVDMNM